MVLVHQVDFFFFSLFADAYETAKMLCEQYYLVAPELEVEEFNGKRKIILTLDTNELTKKLTLPELYFTEILKLCCFVIFYVFLKPFLCLWSMSICTVIYENPQVLEQK